MKNIKKIYVAPASEAVELQLEEALLQTSTDSSDTSVNSLDSYLFGGDAFGNN